MKFLPHRKAEDTMLVNIEYRRPTRDTDWTDSIDIIYKDLTTLEKYVHSIEKPEVEIYFAKEDKRNYDYNQTFFPIEDTEVHKCAYKDLPFYIARQAGETYMAYVKDAVQSRNRRKLDNLHKYKYVFGSDYDIANWYKIQWVLHNHNDKPKPITKQYLDIEVDGVHIEGFPKPGECPINAVTIVDEVTMACHTFLLRNDKNPLIAEFEADIENFIEELHQDFDETYGELDFRIYMYDEDDELNLMIDMFKLINTLKRDFLLIWNMGFDIPYIIARFKELGVDGTEYMCHKDFPVHEMFYYKDTRNFKIENKGDYFKVASYTTYLDQMIAYAGLRKGGGELRSLTLNAIASKEVGDEKLDYGEVADIKTLPYVDYRKFVKYNIKDVLLQMGIERKTSDVENLYMRSYSNATSYNKIFKQTIFLKNRAYIEYYNQGLIIGNNVNIEHGVFDDPSDDEEDEKFDGALVADPMLNDFEGIVVAGKKSMYIYNNVVDMDFSSMYPYIIIVFNIAPNTMVGKLTIGGSIEEAYNNAIDEKTGKKEDAGKDFIDNMLTGNVLNMGTKWFNLPKTEAIAKELMDHLNVTSFRETAYVQNIYVPNKKVDHDAPVVVEITL